MPLLLGLAAGHASPRLPLSDESAAALATALLAADSSQARDVLVSALSRDPALALWAVCRSHQLGGGERRTVPSLADWLATELLAALGGGSESVVHLSEDDQPMRQTVPGVDIALRVAESAAKRVDAFRSDEAYLIGLLHGAAQWLQLSGDAALPDSWLPPWLDEQLACLDQPATAQLSEIAAQVLAAMEQVASGPQILPMDGGKNAERPPMMAGVQWLPALVSRLGRLRTLEAQFQQSLEAEKLASLAEFSAGAGHEINNPLAVISGRAQMLLRDEKTPERRHSLAAINSQALRVHEMIADLMLFGRPPAPTFARVDASEIIRTVCDAIQVRAQQAEIEVRHELPAEPLLIDADATQLIVALRALCDNSIEAIGRQGRINIALRQSAESTLSKNLGASNSSTQLLAPSPRPLAAFPSIEFTVHDTGPGISEELRRHIFDPFFCGRQAGRGIGFGLSKCWRIVANHHGRIELVSEAEQGAKFTLLIPRTQKS